MQTLHRVLLIITLHTSASICLFSGCWYLRDILLSISGIDPQVPATVYLFCLIELLGCQLCLWLYDSQMRCLNWQILKLFQQAFIFQAISFLLWPLGAVINILCKTTVDDAILIVFVGMLGYGLLVFEVSASIAIIQAWRYDQVLPAVRRFFAHNPYYQ